MPLLGAHMSIAGGYYKAVDAAAELGMDCVQIFTKNNNQWRAKPLTDEDAELFHQALERTGIKEPCAHSSYLLNLGSPEDELWQKSISALVVELERAGKLGLLGVVLHPGSPKGESEEFGLKRIAEGLDIAIEQAEGDVPVWLETTAGQGSHLGYLFEQIASIIDQSNCADHLEVCVDTCHIFAAGYPIVEESDYKETMRSLDKTVGFKKIAAFHLNDSKKEFASRVDRHEHIGDGCIGIEAFRHLMNDPNFKDLPMYLETPKGERKEDGKEWDAINLSRLRELIK
ncbi:deoxyribonuclease IV [Calycomorphotria hydatis]|uniref:Probable endonuclease 4 n=1 Tax=Calycomorphotria hydatis TaxID=2528027 RepID=A0A517TD43_9PLAN|nr:deoxyribonuclease IV [Calycomorphotria hydatis]QDT66289.1 Endonuclease 4 [Calycomorphotria hydatis]